MGRLRSASLGPALIVALSATACGESPGPTTPAPGSGDLVVGRYSLEVTAASACTTLPEAARRRSYAASIEPGGGGDYTVTLSEASFLADEQIGERTFILHCSRSFGASKGLSCNQFSATRDGDEIRFRLAPNSDRFDDEFAGYGGMIVELMPPVSDWLGIYGTGVGRMIGGGIEATIDGGVWSCPAKYSVFDTECASCNDARVTLTFQRR